MRIAPTALSKLSTSLNEAQEAVVVELRRILLLTVVDIKYLPRMPDDPQKRYWLVAIDRATRWVYLEVIDDKSSTTTAAFIRGLQEKYPVKIKTILTDNGKAFLGIEHRLIKPKPPRPMVGLSALMAGFPIG